MSWSCWVKHSFEDILISQDLRIWSGFDALSRFAIVCWENFNCGPLSDIPPQVPGNIPHQTTEASHATDSWSLPYGTRCRHSNHRQIDSAAKERNPQPCPVRAACVARPSEGACCGRGAAWQEGREVWERWRATCWEIRAGASVSRQRLVRRKLLLGTGVAAFGRARKARTCMACRWPLSKEFVSLPRDLWLYPGHKINGVEPWWCIPDATPGACKGGKGGASEPWNPKELRGSTLHWMLFHLPPRKMANIAMSGPKTDLLPHRNSMATKDGLWPRSAAAGA